MNRNPHFGAVIYGAPSAPFDSYEPAVPIDIAVEIEKWKRATETAKNPPAGLSVLGKEGVRGAIERLVKLRLSTAITDDAARAELDAIIGALYVAAAMP